MHRGASSGAAVFRRRAETSGGQAAAQVQVEPHVQPAPPAQPAWPATTDDWQPQVHVAPAQEVQAQLVELVDSFKSFVLFMSVVMASSSDVAGLLW
jgi:hypothetical protein